MDIKEYTRVVNGREYKQKVSTKTISISIPLYEEVKRNAQEAGVSISQYTREALIEKMNKTKAEEQDGQASK